MQRETSIGSRMTWLGIAALMLFATCQLGLRMLPRVERVYAEFGAKLPTGTQLVFSFGPAVLVTVGIIAAWLIVLGEFRPAFRWVRAPLVLLVVSLIVASLAAIIVPHGMACTP